MHIYFLGNSGSGVAAQVVSALTIRKGSAGDMIRILAVAIGSIVIDGDGSAMGPTVCSGSIRILELHVESSLWASVYISAAIGVAVVIVPWSVSLLVTGERAYLVL